MKVNLQIQKNEQFRSFYMFFVIASMQLGVGLLGIPRILFMKAGHDAWISILLAYLYITLLLFVMLYILRQYENTDILGVQTDLFGSFISKVIGTVYILYFLLYILSTLVTYIEIIKVFVLPGSNAVVLGMMLLIIAIYTVFGGLRVVIGVTFLFFVLSSWLFVLLIDPVRQVDFLNFLPVMDRGIMDILQGTIATAYTFSGFEILFFIYPFVANKEKIVKPIFLGHSYFTFAVLITTTIAIGFLSPAQLERRIWPVLNLFKIQTSPIIERLDYIAIAEWMMVAMPRVILLMWCISYIAKRVYNLPRKFGVVASASIILILIPFFNEHFIIQRLIDHVRIASYGIVYIYPLLLLPLVLWKKKIRKKLGG